MREWGPVGHFRGTPATGVAVLVPHQTCRACGKLGDAPAVTCCNHGGLSALVTVRALIFIYFHLDALV